MRTLTIVILALALSASSVNAQVSESTEDWPAWQKISAGSVSAAALLSTVVGIGASNADSDGGNASESESDGSSENNYKQAGYIQEMQDELLVLVNVIDFYVESDSDNQTAIAAIMVDFPILANFYSELVKNEPTLMAKIDQNVQGDTVVHQLNNVLLIHFFGSDTALPTAG